MAAALALPATLRAADRRGGRRRAAPARDLAARPGLRRQHRRRSCGRRSRRSPSCCSTSSRSSTTRRSWRRPGDAADAARIADDDGAVPERLRRRRGGLDPDRRRRRLLHDRRARRSRDIVREVCDGALATIAVGSCAFDGGTPGGGGRLDRGDGRRPRSCPAAGSINLPGCPLNVENLTATIVHYLTFKRVAAHGRRRRRPLLRLRRR